MELASANRVAILGQLSASIAEINQPICAVVMGAEAALRLLLAQPTDTEAVRRLLACIVKDGMRTGDIVNHAHALIKESAATATSGLSPECAPKRTSADDSEFMGSRR
jgi:C4-dicarboxylate-specific signal transduction histidine kinase